VAYLSCRSQFSKKHSTSAIRYLNFAFMNVYFISGLAGDSRVFKHVRLPQGYEMVHLDWINPKKK
jgi:hypothetical protein